MKLILKLINLDFFTQENTFGPPLNNVCHCERVAIYSPHLFPRDATDLDRSLGHTLNVGGGSET